MGIKIYKPTSPGRRGMSVSTFEEITRTTPERSLLRPLRENAGRNNTGRVTVRHQGGGHKRMYRVIDFKRDKHGIPARVDSIEYDPNRSARIALLVYADGEKRYIIAPLGLKVGAKLMSGPEAEVRVGNALLPEEYPAGHHRAQRGASAGQGRPDGALRGHRRAAHGEGRRLCPASSAER